MQVRCLHCHEPIELPDYTDLRKVICSSCGGSFSLVDEDTLSWHVGTTKRLGPFDLIEPAGGGAFGTVWKARDTRLDRTVAIKVPRKGQLNAEESEQFLREARHAAQLRHPSIVAVHEVGRDNRSSRLPLRQRMERSLFQVAEKVRSAGGIDQRGRQHLFKAILLTRP